MLPMQVRKSTPSFASPAMEPMEKKVYIKAPDLTASALSMEEKRQRILKGKGMMRGYEDQLNEEQLEALLEYLDTL